MRMGRRLTSPYHGTSSGAEAPTGIEGFDTYSWGVSFHSQVWSGYKGAGFGKYTGKKIVQHFPFLFSGHAVCADGTVISCGQIQHAQPCVGEWQGYQIAKPVTAIGLSNIIAAAAKNTNAMTLDKIGRVWTWSQERFLGDGTIPQEEWEDVESIKQYDKQALTPHRPIYNGVPLIATAIAAGQEFDLALLADKTVVGWGVTKHGGCGAGRGTWEADELALTPIIVKDATSPITNVVGIAAGDTHSLLLRGDGTVVAMGGNQNGQCGNSNLKAKTLPTVIPGITDAIAVAGGGDNSYILKADGRVFACGLNDHGQLGIGTVDAEKHFTPVEVNLPAGVKIKFIVAGDTGDKASPLATSTTGVLYGWGANQKKIIDLYGPYNNRPTPQVVNVGLPGPIHAAWVGGEHTAHAILAEPTTAEPLAVRLVNNEETVELEWTWPDASGNWNISVQGDPTAEEEEKGEEPSVTTVTLGKSTASASIAVTPGVNTNLTLKQTGSDSTWTPRKFATMGLGGFPPVLIRQSNEGTYPQLGGLIPRIWRSPFYPVLNFCPNPSFEYGVTPWAASGCTLARATSIVKFGSASLQMKTNGGGSSGTEYAECLHVFPYVKQEGKTVTLWMKGAVGGEKVRLYVNSSYLPSGSEKLEPDLGKKPFELTTAWKLYTFKWGEPGQNYLHYPPIGDMQFRIVSDVSTPQTIYIDGVMTEIGVEPTKFYGDGDSPRHMWMGTPGNSESRENLAYAAGDKLVALHAYWGHQVTDYTYTWKRSGVTVGSGKYYTAQAGDTLANLTVDITAINAWGSTTYVGATNPG